MNPQVEMAIKLHDWALKFHYTLPDGSIPDVNHFSQGASTALRRHLFAELIKTVRPRQEVLGVRKKILQHHVRQFLNDKDRAKEHNITHEKVKLFEAKLQIDAALTASKTKYNDLDKEHYKYFENIENTLTRIKSLEIKKQQLEDKALFFSRLNLKFDKLKLKSKEIEDNLKNPGNAYDLENLLNEARLFLYDPNWNKFKNTNWDSFNKLWNELVENQEIQITTIKQNIESIVALFNMQRTLDIPRPKHILIELAEQKKIREINNYMILIYLKPPKLKGSLKDELKLLTEPIIPRDVKFLIHLQKTLEKGQNPDLETLRQTEINKRNQNKVLKQQLVELKNFRKECEDNVTRLEAELRFKSTKLNIMDILKINNQLLLNQIIMHFTQTVDSQKKIYKQHEDVNYDDKIENTIQFTQVNKNNNWLQEVEETLLKCDKKSSIIEPLIKNVTKSIQLWVQQPFGNWIPDSEDINGMKFQEIYLQRALDKGNL